MEIYIYVLNIQFEFFKTLLFLNTLNNILYNILINFRLLKRSLFIQL